MEQNWTSGGVFKSIVRFSLPYLASYFLQTLYGMADLFIVGQFGTVADTTAVSIGSQAMHMLTVMIVGLAMGATVMISRQTGARNSAGAAKAAGNAVSIFMLMSAASICAATSGTAFSRACISASVATSAPARNRTFRSCTTRCRLCWCAFRARISPRGCSPTRCFPWGLRLGSLLSVAVCLSAFAVPRRKGAC